jgi:hypothetical protein
MLLFKTEKELTLGVLEEVNDKNIFKKTRHEMFEEKRRMQQNG